MTEVIPAPVLHADRAHHEILEGTAFSRHLNPTNESEARAAFRAGAEAPPFLYQPLGEADRMLRRLDEVEPPRDHPAGALVGRLLDETRLMIVALRDRTAEVFHQLALAGGWYPSAEDLSQSFPEGEPDTERADLPAVLLVAELQAALDERGLTGWRVETDPVMSARVLVDSAKRLLRVHPRARFRRRDLRRLVVHEVDVHAVRAHNGASQALRCFSTGLPGALLTEEGLALISEERAGVASPGVLPRQLLVAQAVDLARHVGFRDLYNWLEERGGPELAWGICLRVKRGLASPGLPGVYAKDSVYLRGRMMIAAYLAAGRPVERLYVGKVGVDDPVERWIAQGWVSWRPVPAIWARSTLNRPE